jgi:hypothetical protein
MSLDDRENALRFKVSFDGFDLPLGEAPEKQREAVVLEDASHFNIELYLK